jgi:hypothetical protein
MKVGAVIVFCGIIEQHENAMMTSVRSGEQTAAETWLDRL